MNNYFGWSYYGEKVWWLVKFIIQILYVTVEKEKCFMFLENIDCLILTITKIVFIYWFKEILICSILLDAFNNDIVSIILYNHANEQKKILILNSQRKTVIAGADEMTRNDSVAPERVQACIKKLTTLLFVNCTKMFFF